VNRPEGQRLDDALDLFHDHRWDVQKPVIYELQMAELLTVLAPWFEREFTPKRSRIRTAKPAKVDKGSQSRGRTLVYARSDGLCEAGCGYPALEWHHRKARSLGGRWDASNGMHLCRPCHSWVGEHPLEAAKEGWYLTASQEPSAVPVKRFGAWCLLDDDGGFEPVEKGAA
jgi:hypothetical protein